MSPSVVLGEKDGSQNQTVIVWEGFQIHKNAGKPKNVWELKDFSEEQQEVELFQDKQGTREQLSLNKNTVVDHSENNTVLRIKRM